MNNTDQAQEGFKTFLLTLSVSLILFSAVYYVITRSSGDVNLSPDIDSEEQVEASAVAPIQEIEQPKTPFSELASTKMVVAERSVLAGATQSTTAVPVTGTMGVTVGLVFSAITFLAGIVILASDPRKRAMLSFERETLKQ